MSGNQVHLPTARRIEQILAHRARECRLLRSLLRALRRRDRYAEAARQIRQRRQEVRRG